MLDIKGRMLLIDWGKFGIIGLIKLPRGLGNAPEDFGLKPKEEKENLKLFELLDSGIPTMPITRPLKGKVCTDYTYGREISEYFVTDDFWLTELEAEDLKTRLGGVLPAILKGE